MKTAAKRTVRKTDLNFPEDLYEDLYEMNLKISYRISF